ncbi:phosphohydrolase [Treponema primitia]|nr:phosphohydrolase [Treponema primitia]
MRSQKGNVLDGKIIEMITGFGLSGKAVEAAKLVLEDAEVQAMQEYANTVSIMRLNYNDHGPVHMRTVALNALIMMGLLRDAGIKTNLEKEDCGTFEDSLIAVLLASVLHDLGMTIGRQDHELHSVYLAYPILDRLLRKVYAADLQKLVTVRSLALEGISGHMGTRTIHSLEAGLIQIADGCDMTKGRARIPLIVAGGPRPGDIHQLSANSIEDVRISRGTEQPIRIDIRMSGEIGLFQIEEVLLGKIAKSTAKIYTELYALMDKGELKRYL